MIEILPKGDPRIPKRLQGGHETHYDHLPAAPSPPSPEDDSDTDTDATTLPAHEFTRGNPGYLDPHLGPEVHADSMAASLLQAQGYPTPPALDYLRPSPEDDADPRPGALTPEQYQRLALNPGRSLLNHRLWPDATLQRYLLHLAPLALSANEASRYPASLSPRIVPLLLGGLGFGTLEALAERALSLLGFEEEAPTQTLTYALRLVGFGPGQRHIHTDNVDLTRLAPYFGELPEVHLARVLADEPPLQPLHFESAKHGIARHYLRHTVGPFAETLINEELYRFELSRKVARHKWWVVAKTFELFSADSGQIPQASRDAILPAPKWLDATSTTHIGAYQFAEAVRLVFEGNWWELDFTGGLAKDIPRMMARLLIYRLSRGGRASLKNAEATTISARTLVGLSLLTGIPTPKFVQFALDDLKRRGETFLTADAVRRSIQLVDESEQVFHLASSRWMEQMEFLAGRLAHSRHEAREKFALHLRGGARLLSSSLGVYQIVGYDRHDDPIYKPPLDSGMESMREEV